MSDGEHRQLKYSGSRTTWLCAVSLTVFLFGFLLYWPVGELGFLDFDDEIHVTGNEMILQGLTWEGFVWAFTSFDTANWFPLTRLSHMLDIELFGLVPAGHHRVNALIHACNGVLLMFLLLKATGSLWPSAMAAILFAVHPLHVESVAWISERKDVLHAFVWLCALIVYVDYARRPDIWKYIAVSLLFFLGFMCKPMIVTLPLSLLLFDIWPLQRFNRRPQKPLLRQGAFLLLEKVPLLVMSIVFGTITIIAQREGGAMTALEDLPLVDKINNALVAYVRYVWHTIWPAKLYFPYPHLGDIRPLWHGAISFSALAGITAVASIHFRNRPYLLVGWLWFLVTLLPVVGLVQVGFQAMADRYMYVPIIGMILPGCWFAHDLLANVKARSLALSIILVGTVCVLSLLTWQQQKHWRDTLSLLHHAVRSNEENVPALVQIGVVHLRRNEPAEAARYLQMAVGIEPDSAEGHSNLGSALRMQGRLDEAEVSFREALRVSSDEMGPNYNFGTLLMMQGRHGEALLYLGRAVDIGPDFVAARLAFAEANAHTGNAEAARVQVETVLTIEPENERALELLKVLGQEPTRARKER